MIEKILTPPPSPLIHGGQNRIRLNSETTVQNIFSLFYINNFLLGNLSF